MADMVRCVECLKNFVVIENRSVNPVCGVCRVKYIFTDKHQEKAKTA